MHHLILLILIGISMTTPLYHVIIQNDPTSKENNTNNENVMSNTDRDIVMYNTMKERAMQDKSAYTVEGTITKVTVGDTSKTNRVKHLKMSLHLRTSDSPPKDLTFTKRPVFEADKRLRVGQRVSIIARNNKISGDPNILHIEPL